MNETTITTYKVEKRYSHTLVYSTDPEEYVYEWTVIYTTQNQELAELFVALAKLSNHMVRLRTNVQVIHT